MQADIWFGPGGVRGVFGAGVACGIQRALEEQAIAAESLRLYGSSVGCLTAAYLATGNTRCGLSIFREDAKCVVTARNLFPLIAASAVNRLGHSIGCRSRILSAPPVLNVDKVVAVMLRRTPDIVAQLRCSNMPVFAECVDRRSGAFRHIDLRMAEDPLQCIRGALNLVPLAATWDNDLLDSNVKGYGFSELLAGSDVRRLVVVLNQIPFRSLRNLLCSRLWGVMSEDPRIAGLYARRDAEFGDAVTAAAIHNRVLVVGPTRTSQRSTVRQIHSDGLTAARRIVAFLSGVVHEPEPIAGKR